MHVPAAAAATVVVPTVVVPTVGSKGVGEEVEEHVSEEAALGEAHHHLCGKRSGRGSGGRGGWLGMGAGRGLMGESDVYDMDKGADKGDKGGGGDATWGKWVVDWSC